MLLISAGGGAVAKMKWLLKGKKPDSSSSQFQSVKGIACVGILAFMIKLLLALHFL